MSAGPTIPPTVAIRALAAAILIGSAAALAQTLDPYMGRNEWNPTDTEVAQLPPYCQADLRPKKYPGPGTAAYGCQYFNHFCPATVALNRAMNPLLQMPARQYMLQLAEDHLRYTRSHLSPACRLAPSVQAAEQRAKMMRIVLK